MRSIALLTIAAAIAAVSAAPASAVEARKREESKAITVAAAWKVIGDFCGIKSWHPAIADCVLSDKDGKQIRTLTTKDGAKFVEELVEWNEAETKYTYIILESPLPVANYKATLSVKADDDGGAGVRWLGTFDAKGVSDDEAKAIVEGIYAPGIASIMEKALATN
ncbi:SRPBCC family protein [Chthonobacter rhizosphaerae]|uniref:SRPBCC family protein n=1 Tax=Chthonobacter rhizosphaerae TaxID=2735553 RepID=UPI0015EEB93A|nr:SRPBCC family protein [Chthonobacter rhizosphaerae]